MEGSPKLIQAARNAKNADISVYILHAACVRKVLNVPTIIALLCQMMMRAVTNYSIVSDAHAIARTATI
jgi:hypothetical protein